MEPINRKLLKENGKQALKKNFWVIMLVCFCANFLGANFNGLNAGASSGGSVSGYNSGAATAGGLSGLEQSFNDSPFNNGNDFHFEYDDSRSAADNLEEFFDELGDSLNRGMVGVLIIAIMVVFLLVYIFIMTITFLIGAFLCGPISVGYRRFFMLNRVDKSEFTNLFSAFGKGRYMKIVGAMFKTNVEIFLWRLLLYFPGLYKYYQYYFVGYIIAENPNIDSKRAKEISKQMTEGHKWQIFVLELSFIGWSLLFVLVEIVLAIISCGLLAIPGVLLLYPIVGYQQVTYAELYEERREYALMTGMASKQELVGFIFENTDGTAYE